MEMLFTWLHLADLRVRAEPGEGSHERVLAALRQDIVECSDPRPDAIVVAGDLSARGARAEHAAARAWLVDLGRALGVAASRVFVVAGNHDVDRGVADDGAGLLAELREGHRDLDGALADARLRSLLAQRLSAFSEAAATLGSPHDACAPWSECVEGRGGLHVRFVGLSTAILSGAGDDRGRLRVGAAQLDRARAAVEPGELVVAIAHHPLRGGWLADERDADGWTSEHAHVLLTGHVHDDATEEARAGVAGPCVWIAAGASVAPPEEGESWRRLGWSLASVVRAEGGALAIRVSPRLWSTRRKRFLADDRVLREGRGSVEHPLRAIPERPAARLAVASAPRAGIDPDLQSVLDTVEQHVRAGDGKGAWATLSTIVAALDRRGMHAELAAAATRVLGVVADDSVEAAAVLGDLGLAWCSLGEIAKAKATLDRALEAAERAHWLEGQGLALGGLGRCYGVLGDVDAAIAHHQRAAEIHEALGMKHAFAKDLGNLGLAFRRARSMPQAIAHLERALVLHDELDRKDGRAELLGGLGLCFRDAGDLEHAIEHFERALALHTYLGQRVGEATMLGNLGNTHRARGDLARAIDHLERSFAIYDELGLLEGQGAALGNLGACYRALGDEPRAARHYDRALSVLRRLGLADDHPHVKVIVAALRRPVRIERAHEASRRP